MSTSINVGDKTIPTPSTPSQFDTSIDTENLEISILSEAKAESSFLKRLPDSVKHHWQKFLNEWDKLVAFERGYNVISVGGIATDSVTTRKSQSEEKDYFLQCIGI